MLPLESTLLSLGYYFMKREIYLRLYREYAALRRSIWYVNTYLKVLFSSVSDGVSDIIVARLVTL